MALSLQGRTTPQCIACLHSYAFGGFMDYAASSLGSRQQIRGKKKMVNNSSTMPVRLRKDVKTFGRKGAIVPISRGQMRNIWFPKGIADYVTVPELRILRVKNTAMERDFEFGTNEIAKQNATTLDAMAPWQKDIPNNIKGMSRNEIKSASAFQKKTEVERLSPERSMELVEIFVKPRLDFYRQPIEEKQPETPAPEPKKAPRYGSGAAADLLAARMREPEELKKHKAQAIYGSVSPLDVATAIRAAMGDNDEAARVVLSEQDIQFVDLPESEGGEAGKNVKHVGYFTVEIRVRGSDVAVRRTVRVVPQEL
ncbi:hypothetical protein LTR37_013266 [Vermiconidia calcicola]|uniref:Uncharacterized protein n=1 Tax=Vermiconidia calcicola TaxID=1690605 RepID=A0ACC3MWS1_9PEZI|nr:hypothetical protein LTR37_013266 [Vermiconidia calcicola]